ncbi:hypothetical protein [Gracilibacillus xinjiangensis]|uniref:Colicin V production protein n=1 Tax=Gracilibacillus xinjiangensis TaxID=1193282 RepID=A0ABV8WU52_9BACI
MRKEVTAIDLILFVTFLLITGCLFIGTSKHEKIWLGGVGASLLIIFLIVGQIIKWQTGFFVERTEDNSAAVGNWVVSFYIILMIYLLVLLNYRMIKMAISKRSPVKWSLIVLDILLSIIIILLGYFGLFFVAFMYFPFAP